MHICVLLLYDCLLYVCVLLFYVCVLLLSAACMRVVGCLSAAYTRAVVCLCTAAVCHIYARCCMFICCLFVSLLYVCLLHVCVLLLYVCFLPLSVASVCRLGVDFVYWCAGNILRLLAAAVATFRLYISSITVLVSTSYYELGQI